jgi:NADP-dependent 3-hydroxy acid dehydrogenase YdfG
MVEATWSTSLVAGRTARPGNAAYEATKWGLTAASAGSRAGEGDRMSGPGSVDLSP